MALLVQSIFTIRDSSPEVRRGPTVPTGSKANNENFINGGNMQNMVVSNYGVGIG